MDIMDDAGPELRMPLNMGRPINASPHDIPGPKVHQCFLNIVMILRLRENLKAFIPEQGMSADK